MENKQIIEKEAISPSKIEKNNGLDEAIILQTAINALEHLDKHSITELKSFKNPPNPVKLTMQCVAILFEAKPKKTKTGEYDYWEESKKLMSDPNFINRLIQFDKDNIPKKTIEKLSLVFDTHIEFTFEYVSKCSKAAANLYMWVTAILKYYQVKTSLNPSTTVEKQEPTIVIKNSTIEKNDQPIKQKEEEKSENLTENKKNNAESEKALTEALDALHSIQKQELCLVKSFANPPTLVIKTMIFVIMLLENETNSKKIDWKKCQKLLANPTGFLEKLTEFDKDNISEKVVQEIEKQLAAEPDFEKRITTVSVAVSGLLIWVRKICNYHKLKAQI